MLTSPNEIVMLRVLTLALSMFIASATAAETRADSPKRDAQNPELPDGTDARQGQAKPSVQMPKPHDDDKRLLAHVLGYEKLPKPEFDSLVERAKTDPQMSKVLNDYWNAVRLYGGGLVREQTDYRSLLQHLATTVKIRDKEVARDHEIQRSLVREIDEKQRLVISLAKAMAEAPTAPVRTQLAYVLGNYAQRPTPSDSGMSQQLASILKTLSRDPDELVRKTADAALAEFESDETEPRKVSRNPAPRN